MHVSTYAIGGTDGWVGAQDGDVKRECTASLALSMLLLLKQHLKSTYGLTTDRITNFNPGTHLPLQPHNMTEACV